MLAILLVTACQDVQAPPAAVPTPGTRHAAIVDGGAGHATLNPHFFWLAPIWVYNGPIPGKASDKLLPTLKICRWNTTTGACIGPDVAVFRVTDGTMQGGKDYAANWKTWEANPKLNEDFRARVYLGQYELGSRDLRFVTPSVAGQTAVNHGPFSPIAYNGNNGNGRPSGAFLFRFRINEGALLYAVTGGDPSVCTDCQEASVPANSTQPVVVEAPSDRAAAVFSPGATTQDLNILIQRLDVPCLPTNLQQYPSCYRFVAEPDVLFTPGTVTVEVCLESMNAFAQGQLQLHKVKEVKNNEGQWVPTGAVEPVPPANSQNITCPAPTVISALQHHYPRLARGLRLLAPLAKVLGPAPLHAALEDEGYGGRPGSFSRIGWARPVNMNAVSGNAQSGATGATLTPVVIRTTPAHGTSPLAAGVPVSYRILNPAGDIQSSATATTGSDGTAALPFTLGATAGTYRLVVTAPGTNILGRAVPTVEFTATATAGFHIANGRVLLYNQDSFVADGFATRLVSTGVYTADKIDKLSMSTIPTLATLQAYGCVLAWTNSAPTQPVAIGNRLKEYVDAGGKVVLAVYALGVPSRPWELQGGIMDPGYSPLRLTENQVNAFAHSMDFTTALTSHPILQGVTSFSYYTNTNYSEVTLDAGATLVAKDNHGVPLIAVSSNGRVVGINVWPGYPFHGVTASQPHIDRAFANACR